MTRISTGQIESAQRRHLTKYREAKALSLISCPSRQIQVEAPQLPKDPLLAQPESVILPLKLIRRHDTLARHLTGCISALQIKVQA